LFLEKMKNRKIIVIAGTTASGKSKLAISLAKKHSGIIINADSRQVYKELNIGSAKPIPDEITENGIWIIDGIAHHLYGFQNIQSDYNIYQYQKDVSKVIEENPDKNIFLVGGTGLYLDCIIYNYTLPETKDIDLGSLSIGELQKKLGSKLFELNESDRQNPRRLISHLKQLSSPAKQNPIDALYLVLDSTKEIIEERINNRVDEMIGQGLENEYKELYSKYGALNLKGLDTIGYREFNEYFEKKISLDKVIELIKIHTRQYAKRQRTWFNRNKEAIHISSLEEADQAVGNFLR
jgi:tRNA dimethylallyltransferase